jgi:hypothetical protein
MGGRELPGQMYAHLQLSTGDFGNGHGDYRFFDAKGGGSTSSYFFQSPPGLPGRLVKEWFPSQGLDFFQTVARGLSLGKLNLAPLAKNQLIQAHSG